MPNAVIYARFSPRPTRKEAAAGEQTIECQLDLCRRYCREHGFDVVDEISDPMESGRKTPLFDRPGGSRLAALPSGTQIVAAKIDRMFRNVVDGVLMLEHFEKNKNAVYFANQGGNSLNVSTPLGRCMMITILNFNEFEANMIVERTSTAMRFKQKSGRRMTRADCVPLGKMADDAGGLVDNPAELKVIAEVEALLRDGTGAAEIGRVMTDAGMFIRGRKWHSQTVARIRERMGS